jgi:hypothetical protein
MPFIAIAGRQIEYRIIRPTRRSQRSALIHAAASARPIEALALMAPHVFVEPRTLESMPHPRGLLPSDLRARWANYHAHVDDAFLGLADTWLQPQFQSWSIEALILGHGPPYAADPRPRRRVRHARPARAHRDGRKASHV